MGSRMSRIALELVTITVAFGLLLLMSSVACSRTATVGQESSQLSSVAESQWSALSQRPIYFGHQSVGRDILAGMNELVSRNPQIQLRILGDNDPPTDAGLHEFAIGENGNPASKLRSFSERLAAVKPSANAVLVMKFCYVDATRTTDIESVFASYVVAVESLRDQYPGRTILHVTMPLTTSETAVEYAARRVLGRYSRRELNAKRSRFNEMLRERYASRDPIFDLAEAESTRADGSRTSFQLRGNTVYTMAPEWTSDGGHLNELGRRHVAERFLVRLATL